MTTELEAGAAPAPAPAPAPANSTLGGHGHGHGHGHGLALRLGLGLAVGAGLALAFLKLVSVSAALREVEHLRAVPALLCGAAFLGAYAVRALRWRWLLVPDRVSVGRAVAIYQVATFLNWLLPVQGGELAKSLMLRRSNGIPVSRSLATVTMDKAMDLLPAAVLLALVPVAGLRLSRALWLVLLAALLVLALGVAVLVLATRRRDRTLAWLSRLLAAILPRRARERIDPLVARFVDTLLTLARRPRVLVVAALYTAVAVGLDALFCYLAFAAVGVSVPVLVVLYGYTFFNLAFILPTPPGHIGSNELMGLLIFSGMFGVDRSGVAAMFLFSHPWTAILMTVSAAICLSAMGLSLRALWRIGSDARRGGEG